MWNTPTLIKLKAGPNESIQPLPWSGLSTYIHMSINLLLLIFMVHCLVFLTADIQACYTRTVVCEDFSTRNNHCSDIRSFGVSQIETTDGFIPQYAIRFRTSYSIPTDTAVRVVTCSSPSECNLDNITAESCYSNSSCGCDVLRASNAERRVSFRCGREDFALDGTTVVWFQRRPDCSGMRGAVVLILRMEGKSSSVCRHAGFKMKSPIT